MTMSHESKLCHKCGVVKPLAEFGKGLSGQWNMSCTSCYESELIEKICIDPLCEQNNPQPLEQFTVRSKKDSRGGISRSAKCRCCLNRDSFDKKEEDREFEREKERQWANARKEKDSAEYYRKKLDYSLRSTFSITLEQYEKMLEDQRGVCSICHTVGPSSKRLAVDHDHTCCSPIEGVAKKSCGKCIRGLLCLMCNRNLGWFEALSDNVFEYLGLISDV